MYIYIYSFGGSIIWNIGRLTFLYVGIVFIPLIIYLLVLYRRTKSFPDAFLIFKQVRYNLMWTITLILVLTATGFVTIGSADNYGYNLILTGIRMFTMQFCLIGMINVNTYWVIKNVFPKHRRESVFTKISMDDDQIKLLNILQNEDAIDVFMNHLMDGMCLCT